MNNAVGKIFVAWGGYLTFLMLIEYGGQAWLCACSGFALLPGYGLLSVVKLWFQTSWFDAFLPWSHCIGCAVLGYLTFFSLLIDADKACYSAVTIPGKMDVDLPMSDFGDFCRGLFAGFARSCVPFVFVEDPDVFCLVLYSDFSGYPLLHRFAIYCHASIKCLPTTVSQYYVAHEASHIYYADVWFRWLVDVLASFFFFLVVSDAFSAVMWVIFLGYCRQGLVRAQEIWADFSALIAVRSSGHSCVQQSVLSCRVEALFYLSSFDETQRVGGGWWSFIGSCFMSHPQGWLRGAIQLLLLRLGNGEGRLHAAFSWVNSASRRTRCKELVQLGESANIGLAGLVWLYVIFQAPFLCVVGLQRLVVDGYRRLS